jgi:hypothetical protein
MTNLAPSLASVEKTATKVCKDGGCAGIFLLKIIVSLSSFKVDKSKNCVL